MKKTVLKSLSAFLMVVVLIFAQTCKPAISDPQSQTTTLTFDALHPGVVKESVSENGFTATVTAVESSNKKYDATVIAANGRLESPASFETVENPGPGSRADAINMPQLIITRNCGGQFTFLSLDGGITKTVGNIARYIPSFPLYLTVEGSLRGETVYEDKVPLYCLDYRFFSCNGVGTMASLHPYEVVDSLKIILFPFMGRNYGEGNLYQRVAVDNILLETVERRANAIIQRGPLGIGSTSR